ncbi:hypothetical protein E4U42_000758 [Claviceps africana]|uniref:Uncharacterized protein n=1 Tax=Claviceps africana TaxID=83212 RepID=A0A8K0J9Z7_9HYPO|nr:hypothetical protein E4U42_000758 [Claviceps africana]
MRIHPPRLGGQLVRHPPEDGVGAADILDGAVEQVEQAVQLAALVTHVVDQEGVLGLRGLQAGVEERKPGGERQAREIWEKIERMDLEVPATVYNAYVGAIAGSGNEKETRGLLLNMALYVGTEPSSVTLAITHNALPGQELQANFREWAQKRYRAAWAELDNVGRRLNEYGLCQIKIKRVMKA